jgi:carboxymethylenebutenolidase
MIRVPDEWRGPGQGEPLDALAQGDARSVLAVVGTVDPWTPPDDVVALEATGATVVRYTGADHAFAHDPARDVHRAGDAADAFARAVDWLSA